VGQDHVIRTLQNAVAAGRVAHAYLFAGPRGTGKTSTARLLAKAVNCQAQALAERPCNQCEHCLAVNQGRFLDLIEIDAASNTSVDDVRDLRDKINFTPNQGRFKVYIVDEVHMLSTAAFNALLKTLEEPPDHAIFVLATTEVHKIPPTVLSRCQRHEFRSIPVADIVANLEHISASEDLEVAPEALTLVARQATGSLRDAVSMLDQLASTSERITLDLAQLVLGTATSQAVLQVVEALLQGDAALGLDQVHASLDAGSDPRQFARQIVDYLRQLLLVRMGNADQVDVPPEAHAQLAEHAQAFQVPHLLAVIRAFNHAASEARNAWQPALPLEMAFVESLDICSQRLPSPETGPPSEAGSTSEGAAERPSGGRAAPQDPPASQAEPAQAEAVSASVSKGFARHWDQILKIVRERNPQTQALLNSCTPLGMKGKSLVLGFNGEFAKSKMESGENIQILRQVIETVLEQEMSVLCVVAEGGQLPPDIDQEGMVATALRDLGGNIVDIQ
jgi:DNA polymerase-3 subunit gamma/tau